MFGVEQLLSIMFSISLGWPFSAPLARKSKLSGAGAAWDFFYLHPFVFLSWQLLSSKSVICEAKRKPRGLATRVLGNQSPYIAGHLLSTFQCLLVFVLHVVSRVLAALSRRDKEKYVCPIFLESEVSAAYYISQ